MPDAHVPAPDDGDVAGPSRARPPMLLVVLAVIGLEALAMVVFAAAVVVELLGGGSNSTGVSIFVIVFFLGLAWLLAGCGLALWRGRRRGRSAVLGWQVFQGIIGVTLFTSGSTPAVLGGVVLLAAAITVLLGLMTRRVVEYTSG